MPEPYWPKKKGSYTLGDAEKNAQFARIRCCYCKTVRYYFLRDLRRLFGDIECDDVIYRQRWRCTKCGHTDTLEFDIEEPPAGKRQDMVIRRLTKIEIIRKPIWRDERGG